MGYRTARRVQILLMSWLTLTLLAAWLPLLRGAMDGPSYAWASSLFGLQFSGAGISGDYGFLLAKAAVALGLMFAGWRHPNGAFRLVLVGWLALMLADTIFNVFRSPGDFRFQGDTLGIDVSLAFIAPALDAAVLLLAMAWLLRAPALPVPPLARPNFVLLLTAFALLPAQYLLLSRGSGQDASDVGGVLLTIFGWSLLSAGLGLWRLPSPRAFAVAAT